MEKLTHGQGDNYYRGRRSQWRLAAQELTDPGVEHIEYGTKGGPEQQIGRAAFSVEVTATSVRSSNFIVQEFTRH